MSVTYNRIILAGNLTRDPEISYVQSGTALCKFGIAINSYKENEPAMFVNIIAWDRLAETCNTYLSKGKPVLLEGRLVIRKYEKDGETKQATEVVINSMQMLSSRRDDEGGGNDGFANRRPAASGGRRREPEELEDEIPF